MLARIFPMLTLLLAGSAMALEEPKFEVLTETPDYEVRRYLPYLVAEVEVQGDGADNRAFRMLAGCIFGDNDRQEKMNMTAPVESRGDEKLTYAFVMEGRYTMSTLPAPSDERVRLRERPARIVAVRRFSGRWSDANIEKHRQGLLRDLDADGVKVLGPAELARYNSPFTPWFLRRNEIVVPVHWPGRIR